jgi:pSer/pThr/pTyr-binding forkhead associated (FHA) protein
MARLLLKFDDRVIDEYGLGLMVTVGRTPDNVLTIDNAAVSSHHACVFRDGETFVIEDLDSTNGTFVNGTRVRRQKLEHGDVVLIGKHTLVFDAAASGRTLEADGDQPTLATLGDTVFLDPEQRRKLMARLKAAPTASAAGTSVAPAIRDAPMAFPTRPATLRVVAGHADREEYKLEGRTTLIGKADAALVRIRGWFKPAVALAIARTSQAYVATPIRGKTLINGDPLTERRELKNGDVVRTAGITLEFRV